MYKNKSILCVVLARAGSKGIKNKNFIKVLGKSLIEYSFDEIKKSKLIDYSILSSDSKKIIEIAKKNSIDAPFVRPKNLSKDVSKSEDAILHVLKYLEKINKIFDYILLIEPTSPLRDYEDIDNIIKFNIENKFSSSVSISDVSTCHPSFMYRIHDTKITKEFKNKKYQSLPRQKISKLYFMEGSLYIADIKYFMSKKKFIGNNTGGYIMPKWKSLEIDDPIDLFIFESLFKNKANIKKNKKW